MDRFNQDNILPSFGCCSSEGSTLRSIPCITIFCPCRFGCCSSGGSTLRSIHAQHVHLAGEDGTEHLGADGFHHLLRHGLHLVGDDGFHLVDLVVHLDQAGVDGFLLGDLEHDREVDWGLQWMAFFWMIWSMSCVYIEKVLLRGSSFWNLDACSSNFESV